MMKLEEKEYECCNCYVWRHMRKMTEKQLASLIAIIDARINVLKANQENVKKLLESDKDETKMFYATKEAYGTCDDALKALFIEKVYEIREKLGRKAIRHK